MPNLPPTIPNNLDERGVPVCLSLKSRESVGSMKKVESEHPWVAAESRATISVPVWFNPSSELS